MQELLLKIYGDTIDATIDKNKKTEEKSKTDRNKRKRKNKTEIDETAKKVVKSKVVIPEVPVTAPQENDVGESGMEIHHLSELNKTSENFNTPNNSPLKKSTSESTAYVPALKFRRLQHTSPQLRDEMNPGAYPVDENKTVDKNMIPPELDSIDEIIANVRLDKFPGDNKQEERTRKPSSPLPQIDYAKERADEILLEAERQKASVGAPTGNAVINNAIIPAPAVNFNFSDDHPDNMFTITNHVEHNNVVKIAAGGFLEVAKLAQKDRFQREEPAKLELFQSEGKAYYVNSLEKEVKKVTNFRQWENGFKVYAAIYSKYNPHRAAEIYQYVHEISLAASSYQWDNVAYYDYHFRKSMEKHPERSWAKTNTQLWSLSMRDPLPSKNTTGYSFNNNNNSNQRVNKPAGTDWKDICCWRWNKGKCNRRAHECRFHHRCSHCGSANHTYFSCSRHKKNNQQGGETSNTEHKTTENNKQTSGDNNNAPKK